MTLKLVSTATTKLGVRIGCSLLLLTTLTGCSSNVANPVESGDEVAMKPEQSQDESLLSLTPDALNLPPVLKFEGDDVRPFAVDWKHPEGETNQLQENLDVPNVCTTYGSLELAIDRTVQPVSLVLSIYHTSIREIDPTGDPDLVVDCLKSDNSQCAFTMNGAQSGKLRIDHLGDEEKVMSLQAEYYADPSLNTERFVNTVGWIYSVN